MDFITCCGILLPHSVLQDETHFFFNLYNVQDGSYLCQVKVGKFLYQSQNCFFLNNFKPRHAVVNGILKHISTPTGTSVSRIEGSFFAVLPSNIYLPESMVEEKLRCNKNNPLLYFPSPRKGFYSVSLISTKRSISQVEKEKEDSTKVTFEKPSKIAKSIGSDSKHKALMAFYLYQFEQSKKK